MDQNDGYPLTITSQNLNFITPMMIEISMNEVKWLMRLIIATKNDALAYFSNTQYKTNQTILQPTTNFEFRGR